MYTVIFFNCPHPLLMHGQVICKNAFSRAWGGSQLKRSPYVNKQCLRCKNNFNKCVDHVWAITRLVYRVDWRSSLDSANCYIFTVYVVTVYTPYSTVLNCKQSLSFQPQYKLYKVHRVKHGILFQYFGIAEVSASIDDICQFWGTTVLFSPVKVHQKVHKFATK